MHGLVLRIHVLPAARKKDVDGRDNRGHDDGEIQIDPEPCYSARLSKPGLRLAEWFVGRCWQRNRAALPWDPRGGGASA